MGFDGVSTVMSSGLATRHWGQICLQYEEVVVTESGLTSLEVGLWNDVVAQS